MKRKIEKDLIQWYETSNKALIIDGARFVGKTYTIREFLMNHFNNYIEINFRKNKYAKDLINLATNSNDVLLYLSALYGDKFIPGETVIFFDEIQECKKIITDIKFLVEDGNYRYVLSGTPLNTMINEIDSIPVGYVELLHMYPMTFIEFCEANNIGTDIIDYLQDCYLNGNQVQTSIHERMIKLFNLYLIVGGMPSVVNKYIESNNLKFVELEQKSLIDEYKKDIIKDDPKSKLLVKDIYDLIPNELNGKNKRFFIGDIKDGIKFERTKDGFIYLIDANLAIPSYNINELNKSLLSNKSNKLLKLYLNDVGLLSSLYSNDIQLKLLKQNNDVNYGCIHENAIVQELRANGINTFYYNNNKKGELDFVLALNGESIILDIKSGKKYHKHSALDYILNSKDLNINRAVILSDNNTQIINNIVNYPIYMIMFIKNKELDNIIYDIKKL